MRRKRIRLSNGNLREDILNEETIDNLFSLLVPIGTILPYAGNRLLDELVNFTLCDGKELARLEYPKLFNVIGTDYGSGDGSTTFNVPDLTSKFLEGNNTAGIVKEAGLPNVKGAFWTRMIGPNNHNTAIARYGALYDEGEFSYNLAHLALGSSSGNPHTISFDASRSSPVYGKSDTVQPASVTVKYIIRCK